MGENKSFLTKEEAEKWAKNHNQIAEPTGTAWLSRDKTDAEKKSDTPAKDDDKKP